MFCEKHSYADGPEISPESSTSKVLLSLALLAPQGFTFQLKTAFKPVHKIQNHIISVVESDAIPKLNLWLPQDTGQARRAT